MSANMGWKSVSDFFWVRIFLSVSVLSHRHAQQFIPKSKTEKDLIEGCSKAHASRLNGAQVAS